MNLGKILERYTSGEFADLRTNEQSESVKTNLLKQLGGMTLEGDVDVIAHRLCAFLKHMTLIVNDYSLIDSDLLFESKQTINEVTKEADYISRYCIIDVAYGRRISIIESSNPKQEKHLYISNNKKVFAECVACNNYAQIVQTIQQRLNKPSKQIA